jgi:hypothetical protein
MNDAAFKIGEKVLLVAGIFLLCSCGREFKIAIPNFGSGGDSAAAKIEADHSGKLASSGDGEVSEIGKAAAQAMREKVERSLVKEAGEANVMLQLARTQFADLKERLVRIKSLINTYEREIQSSDVKAQDAQKSGQSDVAEMHRQKTELRKKMLAFLREREPEAEASLKAFNLEYEKLKMQIDLLQDEVAVYQAATGINDHKGPDNSLRKRLDTIEELRQSLARQADRAKSLFDVSEIEHKFAP